MGLLATPPYVCQPTPAHSSKAIMPRVPHASEAPHLDDEGCIHIPSPGLQPLCEARQLIYLKQKLRAQGTPQAQMTVVGYGCEASTEGMKQQQC